MAKRIAFLAHTLDGGGAERVVSNLSCNLSDEYEMYVMLLDPDRVVYPYKGSIINVNPWCDGSMPIGRYNPMPYNMLEFIQILYRVRREVMRNNIDLVISFLEVPNFLNMIGLGGHKRIVSVRNYMTGKKKDVLGNFGIRMTHMFTERSVAVSKVVKLDLVDNFGGDEGRMEVIYNPVDIEEIRSLAQQPIEDEHRHIFEGPVIVNMARLAPSKGQKHLVRMLPAVKESVPDARLLLIGEGPSGEELRRLARELGVEDDVFFIGFQRNPFRYIAMSSVFVLSSYFEGFPNALVEAMACGVPAVSTDCRSGPREILSPDSDPRSITEEVERCPHGILVPAWDVDGTKDGADARESMMAEVLVGTLSDGSASRCDGAAAARRAEDFSLEEIVPRWERLIEGLLQVR